jgi:phosphoglycerate dehydrogenase-like enzyme
MKTNDIDRIINLGYEVSVCLENDLSFEKSIHNFKDIDCMICHNPFRKVLFDDFVNLKWIQLTSSGFENIPLDNFVNRDILITNNSGAFSIAVAEWVIMRILESFKNSFKIFENQKNKLWKTDYSVRELHGSTIGFIGTGNVAKETAKKLSSFGVKIIGLNRSGRPVDYFDSTYSLSNITDFIKLCHVVVLSAPLNDDSFHIINDEFLNTAKKGITLINIARGNLIDEIALIKAIHEKKIIFAALDVFENEPLSLDSEMWDTDKIIVSPHNAWISEESKGRKFSIVFRNLKNFIKNKPLENIILK